MIELPSDFDIKLASRVFDAAIDQNIWVDLLHDIAHQCGAITGGLVSVNQIKGDGFQGVWFSRGLKNAQDAYNNELSKYEAGGIPVIANSEPHTVLTELDLWPNDPHLYNRPDFQWLETNVGFRHRIVSKLNEDATFFNTFTVQFHHSRGQATEAEQVLFRAYLPFLGQSVRLANLFQTLKQHFSAVLSVMDRYLVPVIIVDAGSRRIVSNTSADTIIDRDALIGYDPSGRLQVSNHSLNNRLQTAIRSASQTAEGQGDTPITSIQVPKRNDGDILIIEVSPLRDTDREIDSRFQGAIVKIYDPDYHPLIRIDGFGSVFGLTESEMQIAMLIIKGASTEDIADIRGVTPATVRTQIKSVLAKTGSPNRTALVRKALSAHLPIDNGNA